MAGETQRVDRGSRLRSLDGLRGVAAVVVVLTHLTNISPAIFSAEGSGRLGSPGSPTWLLLATPLRLFTSGSEAVALFFVLSGLVLTLSYLTAAEHFDWMAYYPKRVLRLMIPVVASVALAALWILISHQHKVPGESRWLARLSYPHLTWRQALGATDVMYGATEVNNPLWSLRWELLFSFMLPLFVITALWLKRYWWQGILACAALAGFGGWAKSQSLQYLPMFMAGAFIAMGLPRLKQWRERTTSRRRQALGWPVFAAALAVTASSSIVLFYLPLNRHDSKEMAAVTQWSQSGWVLGGAAVICCVLVFRQIAGVFEWRPVRWLGRISFSLYLVHAPIVIAVAYLVGPHNFVPTALISLPLAFGVAQLFYLYVEKPSVRLARRVGRMRLGTTTAGGPQRDVGTASSGAMTHDDGDAAHDDAARREQYSERERSASSR